MDTMEIRVASRDATPAIVMVIVSNFWPVPPRAILPVCYKELQLLGVTVYVEGLEAINHGWPALSRRTKRSA